MGDEKIRNFFRISKDTVYISLETRCGSPIVTTVSTYALQKLLEFDVRWRAYWDDVLCNYYVVTTVKTAENKPTTLRLHRYLSDCSDNEYVLHRNGDTLDNRYENLVVTKRNRTGAVRKKRVGAVGVGFDERRLMWYVVIERNGVKEHIGYFLSEAKANEIYQLYTQSDV